MKWYYVCLVSGVKLEWKEILLYSYLDIVLLLLMQTFRYSKWLNGEQSFTCRTNYKIQEKESNLLDTISIF